MKGRTSRSFIYSFIPSLAPHIYSLRSALLASLALIHSGADGRGFCLGNYSIDFLQFQPTVRRDHWFFFSSKDQVQNGSHFDEREVVGVGRSPVEGVVEGVFPFEDAESGAFGGAVDGVGASLTSHRQIRHFGVVAAVRRRVYGIQVPARTNRAPRAA